MPKFVRQPPAVFEDAILVQRCAIHLTGVRDSESRRRAASTLKRSMAGRQSIRPHAPHSHSIVAGGFPEMS